MKRTATLYRKHSPEHTCPYGLKSLDLLRRKGFEVEDRILTSDADAKAFMSEHGVKTTPQTFIDQQRIGGYDDLRHHFGLDEPDGDKTTYQPVIMLFSLAALMAGATSASGEHDLVSMTTVKHFVAFSMCLLALQKLRDLEAFSLQFLAYDLLAQRWVPYTRVYPFVEALAGVGMLAAIWTPLHAIPALFIGSVGAASVIKAVYIDGRELRCACVGGNSNVPLGFVSLTENLMMIAMPIYMLTLG